MSRYIDIEPYEKDGWYLQKTYYGDYGAGIKTTPLISVPTAEPIKHGWWIYQGHIDGTAVFECSVCHYVSYGNELLNYCSNCGAKMFKEEKHE